ncbi:hypothetical protein E5D57_008253 [Metarhizium anisopliae]|nr:hypothetical protein E5D57_008253 [Metarhizium anisopliae]
MAGVFLSSRALSVRETTTVDEVGEMTLVDEMRGKTVGTMEADDLEGITEFGVSVANNSVCCQGYSPSSNFKNPW